jgi:pimeloyl-ACP methyl ester carboxylesterase
MCPITCTALPTARGSNHKDPVVVVRSGRVAEPIEAALAAALAGPDPGDGPGPFRVGAGSAELRRHFRLVLVDNRGSARSGLPAASFDVADMAADVVAVLDGAGIRQAHVLGVSLGGMVAQELAIDHPGRVDALVLVSTTPGWPFAYPMPAASLRLITAEGSMTREVALRRHVENALSALGRREDQ